MRVKGWGPYCNSNFCNINFYYQFLLSIANWGGKSNAPGRAGESARIEEVVVLENAMNQLTYAGGVAWLLGIILSIISPFVPVAAFWPVLFKIAGTALVGYRISLLSKWDVLWQSLGLGFNGAYPICKRKEKKNGYTLYEFTLPAGLCVEDFQKHLPAIEAYAGTAVEIEYGYKNLYLREYDKGELVQYPYTPVKLKGNVPILIGYDRTGSLVSVDLADGEPHLYIAGETGSGKSTALRAMLVNLILTKDVEFYLVDLKNGVEFNLYRRCRKVKALARTAEEAQSLLRAVLAEVERRYNLFYEADCEDIKQYNRKSEQRLKYQLLVIDEFASLMEEKASIALLETLAAKARACGIHIILSTQRPDAKVLNGRIKANVTNILGLKTIDKINSRVIIDHEGLELLKGKGHGIFKRGSEEIMVQCPLLTTTAAKELIAPFNRTEEPKQEEPTKEIEDFTFMRRLKNANNRTRRKSS